jgi:hypothetical protein
LVREPHLGEIQVKAWFLRGSQECGADIESRFTRLREAEGNFEDRVRRDFHVGHLEQG